MGGEPRILREQGRGEEQILEQIFLQVAPGNSSAVGAVGGESNLRPCVAQAGQGLGTLHCSLLLCQPAACPLWTRALCWGCTVCPTDGPGLLQPDWNCKAAVVAKLEAPTANAPEARQPPRSCRALSLRAHL